MKSDARKSGGVRIVAGQPSRPEREFSEAELNDFGRKCDDRLGVGAVKRPRIRHFSHFDSLVADLGALEPEVACQKAVVLLGELQSAGWRGVRPQLASFLVLLTQIAQRDGYSLRVVAQTASQMQ